MMLSGKLRCTIAATLLWLCGKVLLQLSLARVARLSLDLLLLAHIVGSLKSQGRDHMLCTASEAAAGSGLWGPRRIRH